MRHLFPGEACPGFPWTDVALCLPDTAGSLYTAAPSRWPRTEFTPGPSSKDGNFCGVQALGTLHSILCSPGPKGHLPHPTPPCPPTHTHFLSLSLSLSHTHTHTHTHIPLEQNRTSKGGWLRGKNRRLWCPHTPIPSQAQRS